MLTLRTIAATAAIMLQATLLAGNAAAQSVKDDFKQNINRAGSNSYAYPGPTSTLTAAPKGYEPCYLSHYGRHGSRYHIGSVYSRTYKLLQKADAAGVLTERGKQLLDEVRQLRDEAAGRDGELTELGAQQHMQIAERMFNNFPQIFKKPGTHIDAKSTVVIRCILSMESALQQLKSMNPDLDIRHDASYHDMYFMNQDDSVIYAAKRKYHSTLKGYREARIHPERLMPLLFTQETYWRDSINAQSLMKDISGLALHIQNSEIRHRMDLTPLFTQDELYDIWKTNNAYWYMTYGPSPVTDGIQPYSQRNLLHKIISEADSCLQHDNCGVNLRYGHDTMVMPLTCLLELDNTNQQIQDLDSLPLKGWCDYRIFPMACNLQFVFYRSTGAKAGTADKDSRGKDILVKVLRNENEARLPIKTKTFPYYKWSDVKAYYLDKLAKYEATRGVNN